jgi:hypothetical protein
MLLLLRACGSSGDPACGGGAVPAAPAGIRRAEVGPGGQGEGAHAVGERGGGRSCCLSASNRPPERNVRRGLAGDFQSRAGGLIL